MRGRILIRLAALALPLAASAAAFAQASPSVGTHAVRFDPMRREVGTIAPDPDGAAPFSYLAVRKTYDPAGHPVRVESGYLSAWQSEAVAPADWTDFAVVSQVDMAYDAMGRKVREAASGGGITTSVTEFGYDLAGRLKCTAVRMNPDVWAAALADRCVPGAAHSTHGPDRITRNSYDALGELLKVEKAVGTGLQQVYAAYTYSPNGKATSVVDANGNRAEMIWDGLDRQKRWIFPSATVPGETNPADYEEYGYDANANRTSLRKRDGSTLTYQFDALNRLSVKVVPERSGLTAAQTRDVYYDYDNRGLQTKARFDNLAGEGVTNAYDGFGGRISTTLAMAGTSRILTFGSDLNGNRMTVLHPDGAYVGYTYDGLDRMTAFRENGWLELGSLTYDSAGRRAGLAMLGVATSYGYDNVSRVNALTHDLGGAALTAQDQHQTFAYNPASQMSGRTATNGAYAWSDANSYVRSYAANGLNQYSGTTSTGASPAAYTYDANGNLVSDGTRSYVYDVENRLVGASGGSTAALVYDPLGRLFQTSGGTSVLTQFLYDGDELVSEFNSAGTVLRRYIHGPGTDDPLVWYEGPSDWDRRSLITNHQGSIVGAVSTAGTAAPVNTYDPWGIPGAGNNGRFGYTGQAWIPELGLWYYKARFYSPTVGRFLQVDPIGYKDQMNLYAYVADDPVNKTDPDGKRVSIVGDDRYKRAVWAQLKRIERTREGRGTVVALSRSSHVIKINQRQGSENNTSPVGRIVNGVTVDAFNGKGTGSEINYDPYDNKNGGFDDKGSTGRPAVAGLAHEIGHAFDNLRGRASNEMNPMDPGSTPPAERTAIKVENAFRKEVGITPRSHYYPKDPE